MDYQDFCIISFASGEPYLSEAKTLSEQCKDLKLNFYLYNWKWLLKTEFYKENKELFSCKKSGYCAWKPYIILDALKKYNKVLYLDSSTVIHNSIYQYIENNDPIVSTSTTFINENHTKTLTFKIMKLHDEKYYKGIQSWSGNILANKKGIKFLNEWLKYCKIKDCISDDITGYVPKDFKYHLYDQSIYSLLYIKYGYKNSNNMIHPEDRDKVDYYFADTREPQHKEVIKWKHGNNCLKKQVQLLEKYYDRYCSNMSGSVEVLKYITP